MQTQKSTISWQNPRLRALVYQSVTLVVVIAFVYFLVSNAIHNLSARNIASGFGFLDKQAGFAIGETPISFSPDDSYLRAIIIGLLNTLRVSVISIIFATLIGTLIGIGRLSSNFLIQKLSSIYVEITRNIPLILQLFFWYTLISENLPGPRQAYHPIPGVFLSNRGFKFPLLSDSLGTDLAQIGFVIGVVVLFGLHLLFKRRQTLTGKQVKRLPYVLGCLIGLPLVGWLIGGAPTTLNMPELQGFNFNGGASISPEFAALLIGLVVYTAGFIAEIVRSGIQSVPKGQTEAAQSLGLKPGLQLRLIILPQALRVIIPPLTSQYLNVVKNSSLAIAIGYPDIVSIVNTTINQTGQAIEGVLIIMAAYLTVSLSISIFMNWYNKQINLVER